MIPFLISATVLIAAVIALRQIFKNRISRRLQYGLWLIVVIRLILPVQLGTSPISIDRSAPVKQMEYTVSNTVREPVSGPSYTVIYTQVADEYVSSGQDIQLPEVQAQVQQEATQRIKAPTFGEIANTVWIVGAVLMGVWFLFVNLRFSHTLRKFSTGIAVAECPIPVKVCPKLTSPCLSGFGRPTVYLTENCADEPQRLRHILAHELTHLHHGDLLWSAVRSILLCLYWFHPLVWVAAILSKRDCELACDEGALKRLGEDQRIAYGKTLVDTVARTPSPHHLLETATSMNETKKQLKERVNFIVKKPKFYLILTVCVLLIVAVATACTFTGAPKPTVTPTEPTETAPATTDPTEPEETDPRDPRLLNDEQLAELQTLFTGYADMRTNWYNAALLATFDSPQELDAYELFSACTGNLDDYQITKEEYAYLVTTDFAAVIADGGAYLLCRMSSEYVANVLDRYFGLTLEDLHTQSPYFTYWEETDCYYVVSDCQKATACAMLGAIHQDDGTILFECYDPYADAPKYIREVVIRPVGTGYRILSCRQLEKSNLNPNAVLLTRTGSHDIRRHFYDDTNGTNYLSKSLHSPYETAAQVNFYHLLYYSNSESFLPQELGYLRMQGMDTEAAKVFKFSTSYLDRITRQYFGIPFDDCDGVGLDKMIYNPETDSYYCQYIDYSRGDAYYYGISQHEDSVTYYYEYVLNGQRTPMVLELTKQGNRYVLVSNTPGLPPSAVGDWYTKPDTQPLSYEQYFSATRKFTYQQISNDLTWVGSDGAEYTLQQTAESGLCVLSNAQEVLWAVPGTGNPSGIQWLVCDGQWAYGVLNNSLLRIELQTRKLENLFTGEKMLCGSTGYNAANLMVCDRSFVLFAAVSNGKGCIYRLYLPTMTLDTLCDEIPADTLPCWLEIWMPENNRHYPFMFLNPELQPIVYATLADPNSPYKKVIEAWPDSVEEPMIVDMSQAWEIPDLMTTHKFHSSLEWLIISLQSANDLPASVLWTYDQQENAIIQKTDMIHTGNGGFQGVQHFPEKYPDIPLGITPEELLAQLESISFVLDMPDYEQYQFPEEVDTPIKDGRTYNLTDLSFSYYTLSRRQCFTFSFDGKLQSISSWDEELPTDKGLKTGDSIKRMQQIYGTDFKKDVEDYSVYQYRTDGGYLNVFCENDRVKGWSLTVYPNINND